MNGFDALVLRLGTPQEQPQDQFHAYDALRTLRELVQANVDGYDVRTLAQKYLADEIRDIEVILRVGQMRAECSLAHKRKSS